MTPCFPKALIVDSPWIVMEMCEYTGLRAIGAGDEAVLQKL